MARYLTTVTEVYRVDSDFEATSIIEAAKSANEYTLVKYNCENKERKVKGEVIDSWIKVTLVKAFADEKDPEFDTKIIYEQ